MKKLTSIATAGTVIGMSAILAAGCGANNQPASTSSTASTAPSTASSSTQASGSTVTNLVFWCEHSGALQDAVTNEVKQFNDSHPNIHVTLTALDATDKGVAAFLAGKAPNAAIMTTNDVQKFIDAGAIMDLKPFLSGKDGLTQQEIDKNFYPVIWNFVQAMDGQHQYLMPYENQPEMVLYSNGDLLKKANISQMPASWSEIVADAEKITALGPDYHGIEWTPSVRQFFAIVADYGGNVWTDASQKSFDLNNDGARQAMAMLRAMVEKKQMLLTQGFNYQMDFGVGHVGLLFDSSAGYTYDLKATGGKFPMLAASAPKGSSGRAYNYIKGDSLAVFNNGTAAEKEAAWTFVKWMSSPATNTYWNEQANYIPTGPAAMDMMTDFYKNKPEWAASFSDPNSWLAEPKSPTFNAAETAMLSELQKGLLGQESVDQALQNMTAEGNQYMSGQKRM